jgi:N-acetylglucosamine kinase-like BadF-type ATPase
MHDPLIPAGLRKMAETAAGAANSLQREQAQPASIDALTITAAILNVGATIGDRLHELETSLDAIATEIRQKL